MLMVCVCGVFTFVQQPNNASIAFHHTVTPTLLLLA